MKIYIDCDHHGLGLKQEIIAYFYQQDIQFIDLDLGIDKPYPIIANNLAKKIQETNNSRGILICKTGIGMSIVANKQYGVYANNCNSSQECVLFRKINNGNVLCLGAQFLSIQKAIDLCELFIQTEFDNNNSCRIELIESLF